MKFAVFLKRSFKSPIFITSLIISCIFLYMYFNFTISPSNRIKIGIVFENNDSFSREMKESLDGEKKEVSYVNYEDEKIMKYDLKRGYINYAFVFDDETDPVFRVYGKKDAFYYVVRENIYLLYFKNLAKNYTVNLLEMSDGEYKKEYDKYKSTAFSVDFPDGDRYRMIPVLELSSLLLFLSSLIICYDYFSLDKKTAFFKSIKGMKMKGLFVISELLPVFLIYFTLLKITQEIDILRLVKYFLLLYLNCILSIKIFDKAGFNIFMCFAFVLGFLAFSLFEMNVLKYVFLSNFLSFDRFSNEVFLIYSGIYILLIFIVDFLKRDAGFKSFSKI